MNGAEATVRRDDKSLASGMAAIQLSLRVWAGRTQKVWRALWAKGNLRGVRRKRSPGRKKGRRGWALSGAVIRGLLFLFTNSFPFQLLPDDG